MSMYTTIRLCAQTALLVTCVHGLISGVKLFHFVFGLIVGAIGILAAVIEIRKMIKKNGDH